MLVCGECAFKIKPDWKHCPECGASLNSEFQKNPLSIAQRMRGIVNETLPNLDQVVESIIQQIEEISKSACAECKLVLMSAPTLIGPDLMHKWTYRGSTPKYIDHRKEHPGKWTNELVEALTHYIESMGFNVEVGYQSVETDLISSNVMKVTGFGGGLYTNISNIIDLNGNIGTFCVRNGTGRGVTTFTITW